MNYSQALEYINSLYIMGKKAGLENITRLMELMGSPHKTLKFVHIAGTNGKGSTCAMTASVLKTAGYKTGLFISPYIIDFRERIQINGEMISQEALTKIVNKLKVFADQMGAEGRYPTQFEFITAIAMEYYKQENCDIVVLEVGLGGRFDATNVIENPLVTAITSIGLDHVAILGNTTKTIAFEKCGIIKENTPLVCYPKQDIDALAEILEQAANKGVKVVLPTLNSVVLKHSSITGMDILYKNTPIKIPFIGDHQICNCITAIAVLDELIKKGYNISTEILTKGIESSFFPARMEVLSQKPTVILDGAHNENGTIQIAKAIELVKTGKIYVIMGIMADKDFESAISHIAKLAGTFIAVTPEYYRALKSDILAETAKKYCNNVININDAYEAYLYALKNADKEDTILICGSLFLASELRGKIKGSV